MHESHNERDPSCVYGSAYQFAQAHRYITYDRFDRAVLKEIRLFDVPQEPQFRGIEETLDQIIRALPAIRHIFAKPLIRLRDTHELRPIEAVRVIDNRTLAHVAIHSEIWANVTDDGMVVPRKLLTVENAETYAIYENLVFTRVVDSILRAVAHTLDSVTGRPLRATQAESTRLVHLSPTPLGSDFAVLCQGTRTNRSLSED